MLILVVMMKLKFFSNSNIDPQQTDEDTNEQFNEEETHNDFDDLELNLQEVNLSGDEGGEDEEIDEETVPVATNAIVPEEFPDFDL
jgi:hypothetical protein